MARPCYIVPAPVSAGFSGLLRGLEAKGDVIVVGESGIPDDIPIPLDGELVAVSGFTTAGQPIFDDDWSAKLNASMAKRRELAQLTDECSAFLIDNPQGVCGCPSKPVATLGDSGQRILACTDAAGHEIAAGSDPPFPADRLHSAVVNGITYTWEDAKDHPMPSQERVGITDMPSLDELPLWDLRPRDVPRLRQDILEWVTSRWGGAWIESTVRTDQWMIPSVAVEKGFQAKVNYVANAIMRPLVGTVETDDIRPAGNYYVSADMTALAVEAALDLDPNWEFLSGDCPEDSGFMVLEMPMPWHAPRSGTNAATEYRYRYYGITWHALPGAAVFVQFWTRKEDAITAFRLDGPDRVAEIAGYTPITEAQYEASLSRMTPDNEAVLILNGRWKYRHLDPHLRFLIAVWRLMKQPKLVTVDATAADRAARRQASRAGQVPDVSLVHLRRVVRDHSKPLPEGHKPIEWTCRWRVRSFWRRPPRSAPDAPKTIYVPSFIKGPGDAPFRPRVTVVDR